MIEEGEEQREKRSREEELSCIGVKREKKLLEKKGSALVSGSNKLAIAPSLTVLTPQLTQPSILDYGLTLIVKCYLQC